MLPKYHQLLELGLIQRGHVPHELLSPNASRLVEAKAYVLLECSCGITVGGINWQCNLILCWGSTTGPRCNPDRPSLESATAQDQDEMVTIERDAEILVSHQPDFPDARVTHLEEALKDLSDQSATQQFECRGRVQDCSRGFLSWRATII